MLTAPIPRSPLEALETAGPAHEYRRVSLTDVESQLLDKGHAGDQNDDVEEELGIRSARTPRHIKLATLLLGCVAAILLVIYASVHSEHISRSLRQKYNEAIQQYTGGDDEPTSDARPMKIYMYTLPDDLDKDVRNGVYEEEWLMTHEFDADVWVHSYISSSGLLTDNPDEATLFYIPIFPTRRLHLQLQQTWWDDAVQTSINYTWTALHYVQDNYPYWHRTNGRNHFTTLTGDNARCLHFRSLSHADFGEMFTVQHLGDLSLTNRKFDPAPDDDVTGESVWPCYANDRDILLPAYYPSDLVSHVGVFDTERNITALYRFDSYIETAKHPYHGHYLRKALLEMHEAKPLPGSDWHVDSLNNTLKDMAHSIFCITPPGIVAHTSRYWRSMVRGCVPVSFYRGYDLPFQSYIDYDAFTVNISPHNARDMHSQLSDFLETREKLLQKQTALALAQKNFSWEKGIPELFLKELRQRSNSIEERHSW